MRELDAVTSGPGKRWLLSGVLVLMIGLLAACGPQAPSSAEQPSQASPAEESGPANAPASSPSVTTVAEELGVELDESGRYRTFVVVPEESKAAYIVDEEFFAGALAKLGIEAGKKKVEGSTQDVKGVLQLDLTGDEPLGPNKFVVNLVSLATDQNRRDKWIRENALESNKYPEAVFVASRIEGAPSSYTEGEEVQFKLVGVLSVRTVDLPVTFDVTASLSGDTIRGVAETGVAMSDFGFNAPSFANTLTVQDAFVIRMELTAKEVK